MKRRAFLGLMAAAPVAARDAAAKAGVSAIDLRGHAAMSNAAPIPTQPHLDAASMIDDLRQRAAFFISGEQKARIRSWMTVTTLDPDLASSRSLSLSAAIRMQKERNVERRFQADINNWAPDFEATFGEGWRKLLGFEQ